MDEAESSNLAFAIRGALIQQLRYFPLLLNNYTVKFNTVMKDQFCLEEAA